MAEAYEFRVELPQNVWNILISAPLQPTGNSDQSVDGGVAPAGEGGSSKLDVRTWPQSASRLRYSFSFISLPTNREAVPHGRNYPNVFWAQVADRCPRLEICLYSGTRECFPVKSRGPAKKEEDKPAVEGTVDDGRILGFRAWPEKTI